MGGGFELALLCDIIVCSEDAYFALPEVTLGLIPGMGGTQRLSRIIGEKMAMRFILSGEGFKGTDAANYRVAQLVPAADFKNEVLRLAKVIANKALTTILVAKQAIKVSQ